MSTTLHDPRVAEALDRMYAESRYQIEALRDRGADFARLSEGSPQERADALSDFYLPITAEAGRLLYALVRASRPATVVEFGMSLGISTIHLAAAVRDNGVGRVLTTEMSAAKVAAATQTFVDIALDDVITVLPGDALNTLQTLDSTVDFVLLDGWKEFYLPVLELLQPRLTPGALVLADNTGMPELAPYVDYVRDPANGYVSVAFPTRESDSMEISCHAVT